MNAPRPGAIAAVLPALTAALAGPGAAVVSAPPGTGKTTQVPLALLDAPWLGGQRIVMLEPRRLAARAAAARMAELLGEMVGVQVGYVVRHDARTGPRTRIEVITEGVLTRRLQSDPSLDGVGLVIFDEIHERNLQTDLALALTLDVRTELRPDLRVMAMSATLDTVRVAALLGAAPVVTCEVPSYPVAVHYLGPEPGLATGQSQAYRAVADAARKALQMSRGDVLVFLPGVAAIERTASVLAAAGGLGAEVVVLHGRLDRGAQDRAVAPSAERRIVLATNVAETSLTIVGVHAVVDSGLAREPRFDPRTGLTRLETVRISQASATQRAGRAGRLAPGICLRLWDEGSHAGRPRESTAEILNADLAPLALELAAWGVAEPAALSWLDSPPAGAFAQARETLQGLGAVDPSGRLTSCGRQLVGLPVHPRLAAMLRAAQGTAQAITACQLAALLEEGSPWRGPPAQRPLDLMEAVALVQGRGAVGTPHSPAAVQRIRQTAASLARRLAVRSGGDSRDLDGIGALLAHAYPDRVAVQRGGRGRFVLANGGAVVVRDTDPLAAAAYLIVPDLHVDGRGAVARLATAIDEPTRIPALQRQLSSTRRSEWDTTTQALVAVEEVRLGALVVASRALEAVTPEERLRGALTGLRSIGLGCLPWTEALRQWQARVLCLRDWCPEQAWPDVSDPVLLETLESWLGAFLGGCTRAAHFARIDLRAALTALTPWPLAERLDEGAPVSVRLPGGRMAPLRYAVGAAPVLAVPLQESFGLAQTPRVAFGRIPVTLHLLSPAGRPLQVTQDLAGFWAGAYAEVRKQMRGRYPKHLWPEDPAAAPAVRGSLKRRGS